MLMINVKDRICVEESILHPYFSVSLAADIIKHKNYISGEQKLYSICFQKHLPGDKYY